MSINDLLEQGIQMQGAYNIKVWDVNKEETVKNIRGEYFECDIHEIDDDVLNMEISYMYVENNELIIEVIMEEE